MIDRRPLLSEAAERIKNVRIVVIGENTYIEKIEPNTRDDLHQELRDVVEELSGET